MLRVLVGMLLVTVVVLTVQVGDAATDLGTDTLLSQGVAAYRAGAPVHALTVFAEAARLAPTSAAPAVWAGVAAVAAGRLQEAAPGFAPASLDRTPRRKRASPPPGWRGWPCCANPAPLPGTASNQIAALAYAANPRLTVGQARWVGQAVTAAAQREGLDPWLLASVIYIESRFNHQSISGAGAMGMGQLMPGTAAAAGVDPRDPWGNLLGAAEILRWNYLDFRNWPLAIAAYNAGAGAVRRYDGIPPYPETQLVRAGRTLGLSTTEGSNITTVDSH